MIGQKLNKQGVRQLQSSGVVGKRECQHHWVYAQLDVQEVFDREYGRWFREPVSGYVCFWCNAPKGER